MSGDASPGLSRLESRFGERIGRPALWVPSGRFGIWLALRHAVPPGSPVLLSPINCDAVLTAVLAAGLRPRFGPVDSSTGNLDPDRMADGDWRDLGGVLTTNLYGVPDPIERIASRCDPSRVPIVEDACQALDAETGSMRVGAIGAFGVFSFGKHLRQPSGGMLVCRDGATREALARKRDAELRAPRLPLRFRRIARFVRRRLRPPRCGHRVHYDPDRLRAALRRAPSLDAFDAWLRPDLPGYRQRPDGAAIAKAEDALEGVAADRAARLAGGRTLAALGLTPVPAIEAARSGPLWRFPLLVRNREPLRAALVAAGLTVNCIYDPPLHDCIEPGVFERCGEDREGALLWSRHVLPVDPLQADRVVEALGRPGVPEAVPALP